MWGAGKNPSKQIRGIGGVWFAEATARCGAAFLNGTPWDVPECRTPHLIPSCRHCTGGYYRVRLVPRQSPRANGRRRKRRPGNDAQETTPRRNDAEKNAATESPPAMPSTVSPIASSSSASAVASAAVGATETVTARDTASVVDPRLPPPGAAGVGLFPIPKRPRKRYPSDISERKWRQVEPLVRRTSGRGRRRDVSLREVINALCYRWTTGCTWRMLPHDFPPWNTVYFYFRAWRRDGTLVKLQSQLQPRPGEASDSERSAG